MVKTTDVAFEMAAHQETAISPSAPDVRVPFPRACQLCGWFVGQDKHPKVIFPIAENLRL